MPILQRGYRRGRTQAKCRVAKIGDEKYYGAKWYPEKLATDAGQEQKKRYDTNSMRRPGAGGAVVMTIAVGMRMEQIGASHEKKKHGHKKER